MRDHYGISTETTDHLLPAAHVGIINPRSRDPDRGFFLWIVTKHTSNHFSSQQIRIAFAPRSFRFRGNNVRFMQKIRRKKSSLDTRLGGWDARDRSSASTALGGVTASKRELRSTRFETRFIAKMIRKRSRSGFSLRILKTIMCPRSNSILIATSTRK